MLTVLEYDAFISYSHRYDSALGPALQAGLERFAKPWYRPRALRIFRDATNLSAGTALWASIEEALGSSRWFILLASPDAADSEWVDQEVRWWLDHHGTDRLLVVGTSDGMAWDKETQDWAVGAPVPPTLRGAFSSEPRWVEMSGISLHRHAPVIPAERLAEVAAPIRGVPKDMLFGEHVGKHRRAMRLAWGAIAFLLALTVALAVVTVEAVRARQQAITERDIAVSGELITRSESLGDAAPALSRLLSIAAWRIDPTSSARYAMLTAAALPGIATLAGKPNYAVGSATFSPDGQTLAAVQDGALRLWDTGSRRPVRTSFYRSGDLDALAFSPDGRFLAGADEGDGIVRLWDAVSGRQVRTLVNPRTNTTSAVAFSPDGKTLAVGYGSGQVWLWDVGKWQSIGSLLEKPAYAADSVAFSPDGQMLAVAAWDGTVHVWNIATRHPVGGPLNAGRPVPATVVAFGQDGKILASVNNIGTLRLWDVATGQQAGPLSGYVGSVYSVAFSPDGQILATAADEGTVRLWDLATRQEIGSPFSGGSGSVASVAFSPDGNTLASGSYDGTVHLWDVTRLLGTATLTSTDLRRSRIGSLAFSPDSKILASANNNGTVLWDVATRRQIRSPLITASGGGETSSAAFSPDGQILATTTHDETLLWNAATGRRIGGPLPGSSGAGSVFPPVAFSPDGKVLAGVSNFGTIRLWNVASHAKITNLTAPGIGGAEIGSVAFSPNGKLLAAATDSGTFLWDAATRRPLGRVLPPLGNLIISMAFSPDGHSLAVSGGNTVQLLDMTARRQVGAPFVNTGSGEDLVRSVAFSADGRTLAVGTDRGTVQLFDVATDQEIGAPLLSGGDFSQAVAAVAFAADGRTLAVGSNDGQVRIWNVSYLVDVVPRLCATAGRTLTRAEWARYAQGMSYENVCP